MRISTTTTNSISSINRTYPRLPSKAFLPTPSETMVSSTHKHRPRDSLPPIMALISLTNISAYTRPHPLASRLPSLTARPAAGPRLLHSSRLKKPGPRVSSPSPPPPPTARRPPRPSVHRAAGVTPFPQPSRHRQAQRQGTSTLPPDRTTREIAIHSRPAP